MTHITCRLTAQNRDQLRNPTLGNRVWATFTFLESGTLRADVRGGDGVRAGGGKCPRFAVERSPARLPRCCGGGGVIIIIARPHASAPNTNHSPGRTPSDVPVGGGAAARRSATGYLPSGRHSRARRSTTPDGRLAGACTAVVE